MQISNPRESLESQNNKEDNNKRNFTSDEVVAHSINTDSNIIALSFDDCDEYSKISFNIGKPIRSPILLSTLVNSRSALGNKKYRRVTIKDIEEIVNELDSLNKESCFNFKKKTVETPVLDGLLESLSSNNTVDYGKSATTSKELFKNKILSFSRVSIQNLLLEISDFYEQNNVLYDSLFKHLEKNVFSFVKSENLILRVNSDLFIVLNKESPMSGYLCSFEGLMIILNNF